MLNILNSPSFPLIGGSVFSNKVMDGFTDLDF